MGQQWAGPLGKFHMADGQGRQWERCVSTSTETVPTLLPKPPFLTLLSHLHQFLLIEEPESPARCEDTASNAGAGEQAIPEVGMADASRDSMAVTQAKVCWQDPCVLCTLHVTHFAPNHSQSTRKITSVIAMTEPGYPFAALPWAEGSMVSWLDKQAAKERLQALQELLGPLDSLDFHCFSIACVSPIEQLMECHCHQTANAKQWGQSSTPSPNS